MRNSLAAFAACLSLLAPAAAVAGDSATFAPFGYSDDRRFFAYEELSIGDEATTPYATIGIIDLTTGLHVTGSPWLVRASEEVEQTTSELRLAVFEEAAAALAQAGIEDPGHFLALIGDGVRTDGSSLTFAMPQGADPDALGPDMTLDLAVLSATMADRCSADYGGGAIGFSLTLTAVAPSRDLHAQGAAVGAEDCLRRVRLYGVVQPYNGGDVETLVAVVSLYTVGFEGYDRRFTVIPLGPRTIP
jgi:predicted secreted protein